MIDPSEDTPARLLGGNITGNQTIRLTMCAFISVALYNAVELVVLISMTFHRYNGTYFWAILLSTFLGVIPASIGSILDFFDIGPLWLILTVSNVGFWFMVPGQSVVLYSRLHLVSHNYKVLRWIRNIIIVDSVCLIVFSAITYYGAGYQRSEGWYDSFRVSERVQVTWFCVQEMLISVYYISETVKLIRYHPGDDRKRARLLYELVIVNVAVILMDITLLVLEYLGLYYIQVIIKSTIYSVKLKMEFAVLGRLISIVQIRRSVPLRYEHASGISPTGATSKTSNAPTEERPLKSPQSS